MDIYWNIFTMHGHMNVKFPNNTSKWQMEFNSAFKGLIATHSSTIHIECIVNFSLHRRLNQCVRLLLYMYTAYRVLSYYISKMEFPESSSKINPSLIHVAQDCLLSCYFIALRSIWSTNYPTVQCK
jgi:hypothetical protein